VVQGGIGENGHLAFNDPPADFETERSYLVVKLDEVCREMLGVSERELELMSCLNAERVLS
jgi:6-phosphogluconolactonase/glucosamine-6-phosphate isomerase/deaminase